MALAGAWLRHRDELIADFQQYYGMNLLQRDCYCALCGSKTTHEVARLALLAAQLPQDSRTAVAEHPERAWSTSDYLLRQIDYVLRLFVWGLGGGDKSGPQPEPIYSPAEIITNEQEIEAAEKMASAVAKIFDLDI